jgi:hypothetical protein
MRLKSKDEIDLCHEIGLIFEFVLVDGDGEAGYL